jgi:hypothetical protein
MSRYSDLERKHGTFQEFEAAAWNTLGECSMDEISAACTKYRRELAEARLADLADQRRRHTDSELGPTAAAYRAFIVNECIAAGVDMDSLPDEMPFNQLVHALLDATRKAIRE